MSKGGRREKAFATQVGGSDYWVGGVLVLGAGVAARPANFAHARSGPRLQLHFGGRSRLNHDDGNQIRQ